MPPSRRLKVIGMTSTQIGTLRPASTHLPPVSGAAATPSLPRAELLAAALAAVLLLALRVTYHFSHAWNSDEPQHLHVVWAWTAGLLPYRDVFDNHSPLFHLLMSPLLSGLGERADIVHLMRWAMLPFFLGSLGCIYWLGTRLYSRRVGLWGAMLAGSLPDFFFLMGEFRTDALWTFLWLLGLAVLLGGPLTLRRLFWTGAVLGAAFSVSMKTTFLLLTLASAGAVTALVYHYSACHPKSAGKVVKTMALGALAMVAGILIIPGLLTAYFASRGALEPLYRCVIQANLMPGDHLPSTIWGHLFNRANWLLLPVLALTGLAIPLANFDLRRWLPRVFLMQITGLFYPILRSLWPVVTAQDFLPWVPLVALHAAVLLCFVGERWARSSAQPWQRALPAAAAVLLAFAWTLSRERCWDRRHNDRHVEALAAVLRLATPGSFVMDAKGETIFRPRPYYHVLERLTLRRLEIGDLPDEIIPRLIESRTAIVRLSERMPKSAKEFIHANYLPIQHAHVIGKRLSASPDGMVRFEVAIPGDYTVLRGTKPIAEGQLDGRPLEKSAWLSAGPHELWVEGPQPGLAILWARAADFGYSPN